MIKTNSKNQKGFTPLVIAIIITALLVLAGAIYFLVIKKQPLPFVGEKPEGGKIANLEQALDELQIVAPELDMSLSPLPRLNLSALNLSTSQLPAMNIFTGFSVNSDFSYKGSVNLSVPTVPFTYTPGTSSQVPTQTPLPSQTPNQTPLPSQTPSQLEVNSTNCSQFATVPSSQYCSMVPANVKVLCEQCKSAGF